MEKKQDYSLSTTGERTIVRRTKALNMIISATLSVFPLRSGNGFILKGEPLDLDLKQTNKIQSKKQSYIIIMDGP